MKLTVCFLIGIILRASGSVLQIGNDDVASSAVIRGAPGLTMLISAPVATQSTLFALRAYFVNNSPMILQLWRPSPTSPQYQLVANINITPNVTKGSEDIYLSDLPGGQCIQLLVGDTLAAYFPQDETPLPYVFNPDTSMSQVLTYTVRDVSKPVRVGDVVRFDSLAFPYRFSMAGYAYIDDNNAGSTTGQCPPQNVRIPDNHSSTKAPTTTLPRTAPPGDTGATGPQGGQGATGPRGMDGPAGSKGTAGSQGHTGGTGPLGPVGPPGIVGASGPGGREGQVGRIGDTGAQGAAGATGDTGPSGPDGPPGTYPTPQPPGAVTDNEDGRWWRQRWVVRMVYIWLAVLSFFSLLILVWSVILCCIYCSGRRSLEQESRRHIPAYINAYNESDSYNDKTM